MTANQPSVLIVGAGFGGLGMALELKRHGFDNFVVLEKGDAIGGVWRANTYPGSACDAPSVLYSYSYEPNAAWPQRFSPQADIQAYMRDVASRNGIDRHIRFGTEVATAAFDDERSRWRIETVPGEVFEAEVFIPAVGLLSRPSTPNIPGQDTFTGPAFHSAEWNHDVDLRGKRVAVIGTGASAIQFVPQIQPDVAQLTVFQRSAPYIIPKLDREFRPLHHWLFGKLPVLQKSERLGWWAFCEFLTAGITGNKAITAAIGRLARWHMEQQVADPELRAKLTPDYAVGCKRALQAGNYYPALTQPNVHLETGRITEITERGVRTADGSLHTADVIIYGTGFTATEFLAPMRIRGTNGRDLRAAWARTASAFYGIAVPEFPNMFIVYGPNTSVGAGSILYMLERQARYIRQAVSHLAESGGTLDVRAEVAEDFADEMRRRLATTVWATCTSWYRAADGSIPTNWPGQLHEYSRRTSIFDPAAYRSRLPAGVEAG